MAPSKKRPANPRSAELPAGFRERMAQRFGAETSDLLESLRAEAPISIRLNPLKSAAINAEHVPWCAQGRYLEQRPAFTLDPLLHAGAYYVQEASSMLLEQALKACGALTTDVLALDLCAAPGGKSTHLLSLLTEGSLLVANEPVAARRAVLAENLWKHGATKAIVTGSDPSDLSSMPETFDLILVDAPCSGEGLFRRDAFAREQWSPRLVQQCATLQSRILDHAWNALAPGGYLIYSTCTWELEEDEAQAARLIAMGAEAIDLDPPPDWGLLRVEHAGAIGYLCLPHRVRGEGFFLSVMRKSGENPMYEPAMRNAESGERLPWMKADQALVIHESAGLLYAQPARWSEAINRIGLRMAHPGVPLAEPKGNEWQPHPAAALSTAIDAQACTVIDANHETALHYLRGNALPAQSAHGTALVMHQGLGIGWVQGAGNRWNNRWPAPWRVRQATSPLPPVPWSMP